MFEPVSKVPYHVLSPDKQILVCALDSAHDRESLVEKWKTRAVATFHFSTGDLSDVVRDLLANPQIRAIVLDGNGPGMDVFIDFWTRRTKPAWNIQEEHLELVRQFVDLFNDDCGFHKPQQPFWPKRLKYREG